jgi:hypothetical protein
VYARHEGVKTGRGFVFGHAEIARLFLRVGEGMSLRAASHALRGSVFRGRPQRRPGRSGRTGTEEPSRQANLAVDYLDAFAPAVIAALHPIAWPRVIILDSVPLLTRGYRTSRDPSTDDDEADTRVGNLKAGTILIALDGTVRGARPCLMQVAGAKDTESWKAFFATLEGAPDIVVADLDAAIARAVRETWPDAIVHHSRHHLAALMRERATADGVPERVRVDDPVRLERPLPWTGERSKRWADTPSTRPCSARCAGLPSGPPSSDSSSVTCRPTGSSCGAGSRRTSRSSAGAGRSRSGMVGRHIRPAPSRAPSASGWRPCAGGPAAGRTPAGSTSCWA